MMHLKPQHKLVHTHRRTEINTLVLGAGAHLLKTIHLLCFRSVHTPHPHPPPTQKVSINACYHIIIIRTVREFCELWTLSLIGACKRLNARSLIYHYIGPFRGCFFVVVPWVCMRVKLMHCSAFFSPTLFCQCNALASKIGLLSCGDNAGASIHTQTPCISNTYNRLIAWRVVLACVRACECTDGIQTFRVGLTTMKSVHVAGKSVFGLNNAQKTRAHAQKKRPELASGLGRDRRRQICCQRLWCQSWAVTARRKWMVREWYTSDTYHAHTHNTHSHSYRDNLSGKWRAVMAQWDMRACGREMCDNSLVLEYFNESSSGVWCDMTLYCRPFHFLLRCGKSISRVRGQGRPRKLGARVPSLSPHAFAFCQDVWWQIDKDIQTLRESGGRI